MELLIDSVDVGQSSEETTQNKPGLLFPAEGFPLEQIMGRAGESWQEVAPGARRHHALLVQFYP